MSSSSSREPSLSLFPLLLFLLLAAAALSPILLAVVAHKDPAAAARLRAETETRMIPFGRAGVRVVELSAAAGRRLSRGRADRAADSARLASDAVLGRLRQALFIWGAATLSMTSAWFIGLANRQASDPTPLWSSPLAAWLSKRSLTLSFTLLIAAPLLLVFLPFDSAAYLLAAIAASATVSSYFFTRNLPARL